MCLFDWVVPAGGVDRYDARWCLEHFINSMYQQNIDSPPESIDGWP